MIDRLVRWSRYATGLAALAVALMILHVVIDILSRTLFDRPLLGTAEFVAEIYMPFAIFAALIGVQAQDAQIRVDLIDRLLSDRVRRVLDAAIALGIAVIGAFLAWHTGDQAVVAAGRGESIDLIRFSVPSWPGKAIVSVGFGLMAVVAAAQAFDRMRRPT